jgi:hypothetical protein
MRLRRAMTKSIAHHRPPAALMTATAHPFAEVFVKEAAARHPTAALRSRIAMLPVMPFALRLADNAECHDPATPRPNAEPGHAHSRLPFTVSAPSAGAAAASSVTKFLLIPRTLST